MPDDLEERLQAHARSFDGLLSLIPADIYAPKDNSDQWQRKKQTPEERRAARKAKLDPDNWKSAKDIKDEREAAAASKRKRQEQGLPSESEDGDEQKPKKRKVDIPEVSGGPSDHNPAGDAVETEEQKRQRKKEQKAAKRARKQALKIREREKREKQKAKKKAEKQVKSHQRDSTIIATEKEIQDDAGVSGSEQEGEVLAPKKVSTTISTFLPPASQMNEQEDSSAESSDEQQSPILSPQAGSGTSSTSSILTTSSEAAALAIHQENENKPRPQFTVPPIDTSKTPRERLEARISQLRAERKADERPARNRQDLLDQRRRKEEERRAAKKEQRQKEKEEERIRENEEIARRFSPGGSGSLLASPRSPMIGDNNNFTFGRVAFGDGTQVDSALSSFLDKPKAKGRSDPATALKAAQNKTARLQGLDGSKRSQIEEQDMWLNAKRKAHGEKVRDDESLLKRALKRKEGDKKRSEKEWTTREEGVKGAMEMKQKRRENNLAKRRDEKSEKKPGHKGQKPKVKRPGFEGSFRGRTGGRKKKA